LHNISRKIVTRVYQVSFISIKTHRHPPLSFTGAKKGDCVTAAKIRVDHVAQLSWQLEKAVWGGGVAVFHGGLVERDAAGDLGLRCGCRARYGRLGAEKKTLLLDNDSRW
jgi:hypothetical protein